MRSYTSKNGSDGQFTLDGETFAAVGMSLLDFADLADVADVDVTTVEGVAVLNRFFGKVLAEDYDRFRQHCAAHRTDGETLLEILTDIISDVAGFPTQQPPDSADGPASTGPTLKVISSDGTVRIEELTPQREAELREAVARQEKLAG